jgi:hypothetical protein
VSLSVSSCCSCTQDRSQYVSLKITCIIELDFI